jgi:Trypsin-co-occurring domain 1
MASKLIRLTDGTLVEAEVALGEAKQISGGAADKVNSSLEQIQGIVGNICRSLAATWESIENQLHIEKAEVEVGLSFEGEGNLFVTRAKAGANLVLTLTVSRTVS